MKKNNLTIQEKCLNTVLLLTVNNGFLKGINNIRSKYSIPPEGVDHLENIKGNHYKCIDEIEKLRVKYNLSGAHIAPMIMIIVFGNIKAFSKIKGIVKTIEYKTIKNRFGEEELYIKIYPEMSVKDIENNWQEIKKMSKLIYGYEYKKQKTRPKLIRDFYIHYLYKQGINSKKIAKVVERIFGDNLIYSEINTIISKLKKSAEDEVKKRKIRKKRTPSKET